MLEPREGGNVSGIQPSSAPGVSVVSRWALLWLAAQVEMPAGFKKILLVSTFIFSSSETPFASSCEPDVKLQLAALAN